MKIEEPKDGPKKKNGATRNRTGANTDLKQPQCVVIPLDHGTYLMKTGS